MKKGFTMIEVMVVIAIIAILTMVILPSVNGMRNKNKDTEMIADISSIQLGLGLYYSKNNFSYPKSLPELKTAGYVTADSITSPDGVEYDYVPLKRTGSNKCTFYHLGATLSAKNSQIDETDNFDSTPDTNNLTKTGGYSYCGTNTSGIDGTSDIIYDVHP